MSEWRLTLDGQNFSNPIEWRDDQYEASWQDDFFAISGSGSFTFQGDAYAYIKGVYDAGYCTTIDARIYLCGERFYDGLIFVSEGSYDLVKCTVNVAISDNGYLAIINNKKKQKYFLSVGKSSNQSAIDPTPLTYIDFHNVTTGASEGLRTTYKVFDALVFLIAAMTNDTMGFRSDFFETGGGSGLVLVSGVELTNPTLYVSSDAPNISWDILWKDLSLLYSLRGSTEVDTGVTYVRIEPFDYWRGVGLSVELNDLSSLTEQIDTDKIYATSEIGSNKYRQSTDDDPNTSYPNTNLITWDTQTYGIVGECVTENQLDLTVKKLIIDSNSIENALNGDNVYDREIFLVETDGNATIQYDILGDGFFFYNQLLNNQTVLGRWTDRIHNSLYSNDGQIFGDFIAQVGTETTNAVPDFDNEISDPGGDYDPSALTGQYTVPSTGLYFFYVNLNIVINWIGTAQSQAFVTSYLWDSLLTYETRIATFDNPNTDPAQVTSIAYTIRQTFAINAVVGTEHFSGNEPTFSAAGDSEIVFLTSSSWRAETVINGDSVPVTQSTDYPLTPDQYNLIIADIRVPVSLNNYKGFIDSITFKPFGTSSIKTEFTRNQ